jgi:hypothetical protein
MAGDGLAAVGQAAGFDFDQIADAEFFRWSLKYPSSHLPT